MACPQSVDQSLLQSVQKPDGVLSGGVAAISLLPAVSEGTSQKCLGVFVRGWDEGLAEFASILGKAISMLVADEAYMGGYPLKGSLGNPI